MHDDIDDTEPPLPDVTPKRWPLYLFIAALLVGAGWLGWTAWRTTDPRTVLVAIELDGHWFEGSMPAARLADELVSRLETLGFTPVRPGDPEVLEALDGHEGDLRAAARTLGAGFVVTGRVDVEAIEHPIGEGYVELRGEGVVEVFHVDDAEADAHIGDTIRGWSGAPTSERAHTLLAEGGIALLAVGEALPPLLNHPVLAELLDGDARTVAALAPAADFVGERHHTLKTARKAYAAYGRRRQAAEKGPVKVEYHGSTAADDALCGAGTAGICAKTENTRRYVSPRTKKLRMLDELETIEWRPAEGDAVVRWSGYNVYGYPRVAPDGQSIGFVEDIFGWAKAPTLIGPEGEPKRLVVDPTRYFSAPTPAPGGQSMAMFVRAARRAPSGLLVLKADGTTRFELPAMREAIDDFVWLDADHLAVLHTPPAPPAPEGEDGGEAEPADDADEKDTDEDDGRAPPVAPYDTAERQTLWKVPVDGGAPTVLYTTAPGERLDWASISRDGQRIAFRRKVDPPVDEATGEPVDMPGRGLAWVDLSTTPPALTAIALPGHTEAPTFAPDGGRLTFEYNPPGQGRDEEIAVVDLTAADPAASLKVLTANASRDRYPVFGPAGDRIFFEQLGEDPNRRRRGVSLVASVPAR